MTHLKRVSVSLIAMSAFLAMPAQAQEADETAAQTETTQYPGVAEIVVTAQFREQNLQDTPLAITAINSELLDARSQTSVAQVAQQAPNVTLAPQGQQNGSGLIAFIRGVGQTDFNFALEPGVGIYVDDVYIPTLTGALLDLMDLDRIEVLRGPQGTLAGRNSLGGAIKLFSTKPQGDGRGSVQLTYGSYERLEARGFADFAVNDKLFARIAAVSKNRNGHVKRLDYALSHPGSDVPSFAVSDDPLLGTLGGISYAAGRVSLRWVPSDTMEVNISGDYLRDRSEAGASVLLYANNASVTPDGLPWLAKADGSPVRYNCQFVPAGRNSCDTLQGYDGRYVSYATFIDAKEATSQAPYKPVVFDPIQHLTNYGVSATIDIELSDTLALKSINAWREYQSEWAHDVDNSPIANQQLYQRLDNEQYSTELRLLGSAFNDALEYTLGGFYFKRDGTLTGRIDLNYAGLDFLHGPDPTPAKNYAVFGNAIVHVTDDFNVTAGLRQSWDEKRYTFFRRNPDLTVPESCAFFGGAPVAGPTAIGNDPNCLLVGLNDVSPEPFKDNRLDWRIAADYRFSPAFMTYAQVSTGYRAGGFNPRPYYGPSAGECSDLPAGVIAPCNQIKKFDPEELTAYEVGFKADLFDRRVRLNGAAFYNDYRNIILTLSACPGSPCLQPNNVGTAEVKGFELETLINPVDGLTLDGTVSYLDFQYTEIGAGTAVSLDMVTPYTPEWKASFGIQYDFENVLGGILSARVDGSYQSHIYTEAINYDAVVVDTSPLGTPPATDPFVGGVTANAGGGALDTQVASNRIDGYFIGNARLTWKSEADDWSISLEVQNLFDKYYFTSYYEQFASPGSISGDPALPRTWAVTVKRDF
ncbi:TonB-dependent receptor [Altericroceibacterium endophyticum]|uniref:TonB-dependent receptor n=1 Tax=Altericroceibacterium endophyticum TaxID=1808508 RepID=A0A6I4T441_9SPHN|nr:TonB-dependent receptor [Altericroceibacterium endophyticum]MXO65528.1 TonB-dependent receptor [Altericroceibacterium endophyticum]